MGIRIVPHAAEWREAVEAFNRRLRAGGSTWAFYPDPEPKWLAPRPGQNVWREFYLAVDEGNAVRGGFGLKPQDWRVRGRTVVVTDWQGPFSEGSVDPRFGTLAMRFIREMVARRPALYSWGHGGNEAPMVQILKRMNWLVHDTPFCLLVLRPFRFLRLNAYLRTTAARRAALDALAFSGTGALGFPLLHAAQRLRHARRFDASTVEVAEFGPWADALWERCRDRYAAIGTRDAASMNAMTPAGKWPPVTRLRVERAGETIGWALVLATRMHADHRFGDLHVGSIVDCLAEPQDAGEVVHAATAWLRRRGVDIVGSNQAHPDWTRGFAQNGYLVLRDRRMFVASPKLRELLEPFEETAKGLHLTNMDGHGPHGF